MVRHSFARGSAKISTAEVMRSKVGRFLKMVAMMSWKVKGAVRSVRVLCVGVVEVWMEERDMGACAQQMEKFTQVFFLANKKT